MPRAPSATEPFAPPEKATTIFVSINYIAIFGAILAAVTAWQARRTGLHGGSFYDREIYGMTPRAHRRAFIVALVALVLCSAGAAFPSFPATPFVAVETVAVILYLASFARGASHEDEQ